MPGHPQCSRNKNGDTMNKQQVNEMCNRVLNMRLEDAKRLISGAGMMYRIISLDGIAFGGTDEHVPYRINLEVIDGVVRDSRVG